MAALLEIKDLYKSYAKSLKASMKYASFDLVKGSLGFSTDRDVLRDSEFWALSNINLNLYRGDVLGVLGHNGAGKSTLLKCIANKIKPTKGKIILNGSLGHMIEMSAGFDPLLTGRENVSLRGNILGFKGKALKSYIDQVQEFAEIEDFFDSPVQFYSSGMKSRLGFAASSSIEPDLLIIDEVLAVGDLSFRLKCYERMNQIARQSAVVFVSHSIGQISRMCTRAIYLDKGKMLHDGDVKTALSIYQDKLELAARKKSSAVLNPDMIPFSVLINDAVIKPDTKISYGDRLTVYMNIAQAPTDMQLRILMRDASGSVLQDWNSIRSNLNFNGSQKELIADLGGVELSPGTYKLSIEATNINGNEHICLTDEIVFRVHGDYFNALAIQRSAQWRFL